MTTFITPLTWPRIRQYGELDAFLENTAGVRRRVFKYHKHVLAGRGHTLGQRAVADVESGDSVAGRVVFAVIDFQGPLSLVFFVHFQNVHGNDVAFDCAECLDLKKFE